jgi:hypothetical protein
VIPLRASRARDPAAGRIFGDVVRLAGGAVGLFARLENGLPCGGCLASCPASCVGGTSQRYLLTVLLVRLHKHKARRWSVRVVRLARYS